MQVILTHEHADFDAIASQVGLARLLPDAVAVLPLQINANVADFLMLYGGALPLRRREDLRREKVARAWLVDTRQAQPVRGMTPRTPRSVVDHHEIDDEPIPESMSLDIEPVGATATMIAERLQTADVELKPIEATLLLLGVHEDTGSLTYGGTTTRDVQAAAWLMDQGADLEVVSRFLRHPLSQASRELLDALLESSETHLVASHSVVIAAAEAHEFEEEISTLAMKLMDLLDPTGLFVLVDLESHIQLVARSTGSAIDVGAVADRLGGGGHERAAAAVVRNSTLEETRNRVLGLLHETVPPATRVSEIMSPTPVCTLAPDMSVDEALEIAKRFGHEGYPVVDREVVLGVVTRRELDRAMHHDLGSAPVKRLIAKAKAHTIEPNDSVESLQQVMTAHDVGQVPVVESGRLVGIATRTDVLRLWTERVGGATRGADDPVVDLEEALEPEALASIRMVAAVAQKRGESVYLVGGIPRDLVLGRSPGPDIDLVVEGDAPALADAVATQHGGRVRKHHRFGTAKWIHDLATIDLATAREEYYSAPTALPDVRRGSLRSDLRRRDFTINTLAIDLNGERFGRVIDYFGGMIDISAGQIRVLHSLSFVEDPTRILRAVRLATRLGFEIEARTASLIPEAAGLVERVTGARLLAEIRQLFCEPEPVEALERLAAVGVLEAIQPGLNVGRRTGRLLNSLPPAWHFFMSLSEGASVTEELSANQALLLWLAEQGSIGQSAGRRVRLPGREQSQLDRLVELDAGRRLLKEDEVSPTALYYELQRDSAAVLALAWHRASDPVLRRNLLGFVSDLQAIKIDVAGEDLAALGLEPGPAYGRVLKAVLEARLEGEVVSREDQLALARRLVKGEAGQP